MTDGRSIYLQLRNLARDRKRPLDELIVLYGLKRFLARLGRSPYARDFCLKGGILLSAHALRRPTRDIDMQALDFELDVEHITTVVGAVCDIDAQDGLELDPGSMAVEPIREEDEYEGLRVSLSARVHTAKIQIKLDVSTGDPIWPKPEQVELPALLGGFVEIQGHPLVTVIAEKTVTMLQRGTTSIRWRDLLDIGVVADRSKFEAGELQEAVGRVAAHRSVQVVPLAPRLSGYQEVGQVKWAAWRRRQKVEHLCLGDLGEQVERVLAFVGPVFDGTLKAGSIWDPGSQAWS
ncbi:nucleotidyl transferase AbiEii/AbiGii toxin family protein [Sinomonas humi]|uniref:nucleotidyl transferase AbiEii/AbiGii toxin family protein n=1 Tax=Sinomonas humi TaxID=1338436 RepID=UPI000690420F|nr:nucleotidyl transferase AbiEii/AbiGii toxin family protein [Sinomonas humi]